MGFFIDSLLYALVHLAYCFDQFAVNFSLVAVKTELSSPLTNEHRSLEDEKELAVMKRSGRNGALIQSVSNILHHSSAFLDSSPSTVALACQLLSSFSGILEIYSRVFILTTTGGRNYNQCLPARSIRRPALVSCPITALL